MAKSSSDPKPTGDLALPAGARIACVHSTYHADLIERMLDSARSVLSEAGLGDADRLEVSVPGAFELPIVAQRLAQRTDVYAVLCFGLVLRGETDHDRYISSSVASALQTIGLETKTPVLFGLLTPNTLEQARARALPEDEGGQDKGREVARAAVEVLVALERAERVGR